MRRLEGAYSIVALSEGRLVAFRDPHGFRPLVIGRFDDDWVVASETCALDLVGAEFVREVAPGELVIADADGPPRRRRRSSPTTRGALCIWEFFYLARPDSRLEGIEVHNARVRMGERLAREAPVDADLVLPIPDSGTPAAIGFARALGLPFSEGLIKNRYVQRTFIQPDQELRRQGIRLKYHPVAEVAGKRVVAVDDSIVRGNTTREIVRMLFDAGAAEVHVRISSPPVIGQCFYGIDLADPSEMIAATRTVEEVREHDRRHLARLPLPRRARRGDAAAGVGALPRLPHGRVPDRGSRGGREAPLRAARARGRWQDDAVQLFHYHLVTSRVREVEARYIGKLAFDLVARHGRIGEDLTSYEPGVSWERARRDGLQAPADRAREGSGQRRRPAGPVADAARRPPRARARRGRVRGGARARRAERSARPGARRPAHVRLDERRLPARAPPAARVDRRAARAGRRAPAVGAAPQGRRPVGRRRRRSRRSSTSRRDGSDVEVGDTVVRFVRGGPQGRPELFGELFV